MIGIESGKHFACAAFVRTTVVTIIPSPLQRLHGFGYNGIVRIHLSTWLVLQLEGSAHSVPRDVTLPSLDIKVPHLTDAEEDRYSSLFKDVDVGSWYCVEALCDIGDARSNLPWLFLRLQK